MSIPESGRTDLARALQELRSCLAALGFPHETAGSAEALEAALDAVNQLDDYILPRLARLDAPLLGVVGGSTGSGKSTLVNSIVREHIAPASAIRPTTRRPLLVHCGQDAPWFEGPSILPGLARVRGKEEGSHAHSELVLARSEHIPAGLALLDSPDIDSVVEENRRLASQLMSAADLWLFVTTAARYADAIPWAMLDDAAARNVVVAIVLNRVPAGVGAEVRADLSARLGERGLGHAPLFVAAERLDSEGFVPEVDVAPIRGWLEGLARDAKARASVARQTLRGAVEALLASCEDIAQAVELQGEMSAAMIRDVDAAGQAAVDSINSACADGRILRGEVLQRWNEVVGTGAFMRSVESGVSRVRDRVSGWFRGKKPGVEAVEQSFDNTLVDMCVAEAERALSSVDDAWRMRGGADDARRAAAGEVRGCETREEAARHAIAQWRTELSSLVSAEGSSKKASARIVSIGVNVVGAALMVVVFSSTAGLTGTEAAIAGGTAVVAQRLLEGIFGDEAVRSMTKTAREGLLAHMREFVDEDLLPFRTRAEEARAMTDPSTLDAARKAVARSYRSELGR